MEFLMTVANASAGPAETETKLRALLLTAPAISLGSKLPRLGSSTHRRWFDVPRVGYLREPLSEPFVGLPVPSPS